MNRIIYNTYWPVFWMRKLLSVNGVVFAIALSATIGSVVARVAADGLVEG